MRAYERFLKYVSYDTTSDESAPNTVCPSTEKQKVLARFLVEEMKCLGMDDAHMDDSGYVYGTLPANCAEKAPVIGLISHMDTSPSASGAGIQARIVENYDGGDIVLNQEKSIVMSPLKFESLCDYKGKDLIVTDGTTLLGADDKAGVAEIITAMQRLNDDGVKHGKIAVAFTPDEEIGRGADKFDVEHFGADYAYTVDGGKLGEIEYENFNAAAAIVTVNGVNIHPGDAKNKMKNAMLMGIEFNSMLPPNEIPACTEGYEGFHHLSHMEGDEEKTVLRYIIRDHDMYQFTEKKTRFEKIAHYLNEKYGDSTIELDMHDSYFNMKEKIEPHMFIIEKAQKAMKGANVESEIVAIRGGTDGARLSFMGLPCPNLSTGGHNFHGRFEYIPVQSMDSMVEVLINIVKAQ
nr:peptidase T [uncultured Caproiciproducens sp.]